MTSLFRNATLGLALLGMSATAQALQVTDKFDASGWVWIMDRTETTTGNSNFKGKQKSGMDVDEAELDFGWKLDDNWKANVGFIYGYWGSGNGTPVWMMKRGNIAGKDLFGEGSKVVVGLQGSSYVVNIEGPWGMNWLDGYTLGLQDGGFVARHAKGLMIGSKNENFRWDAFVHTQQPFASGDSIKTGEGRNLTVSLGYDFMPGFLGYVSYTHYGAADLKPSSGVANVALMMKDAMPLDFLLEYATMNGQDPDSLGYTCNNCGTSTGDIKANAYAAHLNFNVNDKVSIWARYVSGNDDFVNKLGGVKYGQWGPTFASGASTKSIKDRISIGPTYTIIKDTLKTALVYESGTLSDAAKADAANTAADLKTVSAVRLHLAAFF